MTRTLTTLAALLLTPIAHAAPGAVWIDHATVSLGLSVENVSGSSDVKDRVFGLVSAQPVMHAEGDFGCPVGTSAQSIELMFGKMWMMNDAPTGFVIWDASPELPLGGAPFGAWDIDHELDLPTSWTPGEALVTFDFHPAKLVDDQYLFAQNKGADMVHWMQSDQVFETSFSMNAVLWCEGGDELVGGLATVEVDVSVLYHGDRGIQYQPITTTPGDVTTGDDGPIDDVATGTGGTGTGGTGGTSTGTTTTTATATTTTATTR